MELRPYDPGREADRAGLWACKRRFETGLGEGDETKAARYEAKLTDEYRRRWLAWVDRCVSEQPRSVTLAVRADGSDDATRTTGDDENDTATDDATETTGDDENGTTTGGVDETTGSGGGRGEAESSDEASPGSVVRGYVFLLPESLAFVWDAAVVNEIYVRPANRGTGLADDLFEAALSLAREQELPLDRLLLDVDRENERARAFYDRHGFEHWGEMVAREL